MFTKKAKYDIFIITHDTVQNEKVERQALFIALYPWVADSLFKQTVKDAFGRLDASEILSCLSFYKRESDNICRCMEFYTLDENDRDIKNIIRIDKIPSVNGVLDDIARSI